MGGAEELPAMLNIMIRQQDFCERDWIQTVENPRWRWRQRGSWYVLKWALKKAGGGG